MSEYTYYAYTGKISSSTGGIHEVCWRVILGQDRNISANTSTISWTLQWYATSATSQTHRYQNVLTLSINGSEVYNGAPAWVTGSVSAGAAGTIASGSVTVSHNTDGSKSLPISIYYYNSEYTAGNPVTGINNAHSLRNLTTYSSGLTAAGSITLTAIPRASTVTATAKTLSTTATSFISWTPYSSSFTFNIYVYKGSSASGTAIFSKTGYAPATTSSITYSGYQVSYSNVSDYINSTATTGYVTVLLQTVVSGTVVGSSTSTALMSLSANITTRPSGLSITLSEGTNAISNISLGSNKFIYGSKIKYTCAATGAGTGATISSYSLTLSHTSGTFSGTSGTACTVTQLTAGTYTATLTVTNSRGYSATTTATYYIVAYALPTATTLTSAKAYRVASSGSSTSSSTGAYIYTNPVYTCSSNAAMSSNSVANVKVYYKKASASSYSSITRISSSTNTTTFAADTDVNYNVYFIVTDAIGNTATSGIYTVSAAPVTATLVPYF